MKKVMQTVTDLETGKRKRVEVTKRHRLLEIFRISYHRPNVASWLVPDQRVTFCYNRFALIADIQRLTSKSSQPVLLEWSTETGQNHVTQSGHPRRPFTILSKPELCDTAGQRVGAGRE